MCPILGPLVHPFWISRDVSSGLQSLIHFFCGGKCNVYSPRTASGATLANLLRFEPAQKTKRATIVRYVLYIHY